ncbi:class I SAM-dependent methyltransferase [Romboutsia sedimentorum]|uniref:Class I SAM-dependent methyltransferase n=1 Tax=Romboutsia sedimentorum TaxID=1368474 RepID=A0ABT7E7L7_9FIRM|nr:class I SAM-dependent methyltransferase [Romboutsia sedimentorum]MDK2562687.1 class I SAM-dependent methyltransferase [Romboutsia sedimentorum]
MDKNYWIDYYKKNKAPKQPSLFAMNIINILQPQKKLLELGCGNGRDSIFFANKGILVTGIDQAESSIRKLNEEHTDITFLLDDFVNTNLFNENNYDYIYSRFSMHSISLEDEKKLLNKAYKSLKNDGKIFIEARSIKDDFYGLGEKIGKNEYIYEKHYRRFIEINETEKYMKEIGYKIELCVEDKGFAVYKNQDPVVIRIIASK